MARSIANAALSIVTWPVASTQARARPTATNSTTPGPGALFIHVVTAGDALGEEGTRGDRVVVGR